jgi:hypothetical protein
MVKMCEQVNGIVALEANITSVTAQQQIKLNDPSTVSGWCYNVCCTVASLGLVSPSAVTDGVTRMDTGSHERSLLSAVHKCWWPFLVIMTNHSPRFFLLWSRHTPLLSFFPPFRFPPIAYPLCWNTAQQFCRQSFWCHPLMVSPSAVCSPLATPLVL